MDEKEISLIALVARILGFLRDHNQHCYTAEVLASKESIKREEDMDAKRMHDICEELCKEGLIEPKREDEVRCYRATR
jgi:predicted transcriptional regulator